MHVTPHVRGDAPYYVAASATVCALRVPGREWDGGGECLESAARGQDSQGAQGITGRGGGSCVWKEGGSLFIYNGSLLLICEQGEYWTDFQLLFSFAAYS